MPAIAIITRNLLETKCFRFFKCVFILFLQRFHAEDYVKFKAECERDRTLAPNKCVPFKVQLKLPSQRVLFNRYFQIVSKKNNRLAAKCQICTETKILVGNVDRCSNFSAHLKVSVFDFKQFSFFL